MGAGCCVDGVVVLTVLVAMVVAAVVAEAVAHRETTSDKRQDRTGPLLPAESRLSSLLLGLHARRSHTMHPRPTTHREPIRPELAHSPSVAIPVLRAAAYCADHTVDDDNAPRSTLRPV
jgi:hypothetical protein